MKNNSVVELVEAQIEYLENELDCRNANLERFQGFVEEEKKKIAEIEEQIKEFRAFLETNKDK